MSNWPRQLIAGLVVTFTWLLTERAGAEPSKCLRRPNAVVADLGLHVVNAGYQRTVGCYLALQASAGLYVPWMVNANVFGLGGGDRKPDGAFDVAGVVVRMRPFVYPLGTAPAGFWISPFLQLGYARGQPADGTDSFDGFAESQGLSIGGTVPLGRVLLGLGAGAQFHLAMFHGNTNAPGFALPAPHVDINLGYSF